MKDKLSDVVAVLGLSFADPPSNDGEQELLETLVEGWLEKHGEEWVRNNFLLELEWVRLRGKMK